MARQRTLRRQLALWMCVSSLAAIAVLAIATYVAVDIEERDEAGEVGEHGDPDDSAVHQVLSGLAVGVPCAVLISIGVAGWVSRRVAAPIQQAIQTATEISVDRFDRRMTVTGEVTELRAMAVAINDLVDRLGRGYFALAAFSADASHELRTPLAAVCSELEVALRRPRSVEDWEASAKTVLGELRRLAHVVDAMLRFAQADIARNDHSRERDPGEVVDDVAQMFAAAARTAGVQLVTVTEPGAADTRVRGDSDLLGTALGNLVSNAVRLTPDGGKVTLSVAVAGDDVVLAVDDTGPGLPADRAGLFVPFGHRGSGGVGLGLAMARRIAERHHGTLTASDRSGGGARFELRLPRVPRGDVDVRTALR